MDGEKDGEPVGLEDKMVRFWLCAGWLRDGCLGRLRADGALDDAHHDRAVSTRGRRERVADACDGDGNDLPFSFPDLLQHHRSSTWFTTIGLRWAFSVTPPLLPLPTKTTRLFQTRCQRYRIWASPADRSRVLRFSLGHIAKRLMVCLLM